MTEYYTINEMYGEKFYQVPKVFFTNPLYKDNLTPLEKMAFGMLKDRFSLSVKNKWFDDQGRIYFVFTQENLMEIFDCSKQTASNVKKNLKKVGLLEIKKRGQGRADLLYLKKPIVTENDIYEIDKVESVGTVEKSKNETPRSVKNRPQEVSKIDRNDTDLKDTDLKKIEEEEESITLTDVISFMNDQIDKREITNKKTTLAIFEVAELCRAIGTNDRGSMESYCIKVVEEKMAKLGQKQKQPNKPVRKQHKPTRTEVLPDWFDNPSAEEKPSVDPAAKKQEIDDMLKKLREE